MEADSGLMTVNGKWYLVSVTATDLKFGFIGELCFLVSLSSQGKAKNGETAI
jgi:hypothetical protein